MMTNDNPALDQWKPPTLWQRFQWLRDYFPIIVTPHYVRKSYLAGYDDGWTDGHRVDFTIDKTELTNDNN